MITFDAKKHKYSDEDGIEYISVTTLLGQLFPFDRNMIAKQISNNPNSPYYKWPLKKIFKDWSDSAVQGTILHNACEKFILDGIIPDDDILKICVQQYAKLKFKGKTVPEQLVYSKKLKIAGTIDLLEFCDNIIYIYDIKTYKKITKDRIHKLSLQLEIYKRLAEEIYNKKCQVMGAFVFEDYVRLGLETKLAFHKTIDVKDEVDIILENRYKQVINEMENK
jgi:hypothetical protein